MVRRKTQGLVKPVAAVAVIWLVGIGTFAPLDPSQTARAATVVINEINYHPASDLELEEFIELWNDGATTVTLTGWRFTRGIDFTFTTGTTIGPNGYLVVARDPATLAPLAPGARIVGPWIGTLRNGDELIRLKDGLGFTVDEVHYQSTPPWPTTPDGRGASLERICPTAPGTDPANWMAATGPASSDWIQVTQTGTATSSRLYLYLNGPGEVLLDDVRIVAEGTSTNLVNNGGFELTFSPPWTPTGNHSGSYRALDPQAHSGSCLCRLVSTGVGGSYTDSLNQYTQTLDTVGGTQYTLSFWAKPVSGAPTITARLSGFGLSVTGSLTQATVMMTPGRANTAYRAALPPFADPVTHTPECPRPSNPVTVSARVRDPDAVNSVSLLYQTLTSSAQSPVTTLQMTRTSGTAQLGIWTAQIPAQADRTLVRYRIRATDSFGGTRVFPDPTEARDTFSYFQYADTEASSIPVAFLYELGPAVPQDSLRGNVALVIRPPGPTSRWEVYDHILRSDRAGGHNIFFLDNYEYDGMSGINVVWEMSVDPLRARFPLSEYMCYEMHRAVGSLGEKAGHFHLFRNDTPLGYHMMFEQPNKTFLARNGFNNNGNLYKVRYDVYWPEKKTNLSLGDQDVRDFRNTISALSGTALTNYIFQNLNVEQFIRYYVGNTLTTDWDGYFNNHYLYHDTDATHLWYIIPWDRDKTWGDNDAFQRHPTPGGVAGLCYLYPIYDQPILFGANGTPPSGLDNDSWWRGPGWISGPFLADPKVQPMFIKRLEDAALRIFTPERWFPVLDALEHRLEPEAVLRATLQGENPNDRLTQLHNDIESFRRHFIYRRAFILGAVNPLTYPNVTAISPGLWETLPVGPSEITVTFTEPISTATISAATFRLVRSGGDYLFGQADDVTIAASSPPRLVAYDRAWFPLAGRTLPPDLYRITLVGTGASPVRDTVGNALDGETSWTLPSGDGLAGGNFVSYFFILGNPKTSSRSSWRLYR